MTPKISVETKDLKVLILDDNPDIRRFLKTVLESKFQFTILEAGNGKEGLSILDSYTPFLIICDIMMPEMDGKEFIRRLKRIEAYKNIPIIVISAVDEKPVVIELIQEGIIDYLLKPVSPFFLIKKIIDYVNKYQVDNQLNRIE